MLCTAIVQRKEDGATYTETGGKKGEESKESKESEESEEKVKKK